MEKRFSQNFNKLYYSIGEVAEAFGVNASLIRFWEKEFDAIKPKKNAKGNRKFTPKDIEILEKIYDLVKVKGFTLEGAKKALNKKNQDYTVALDSTTEIKLDDIKPDTAFLVNQLRSIRTKLTALKS